MDTLLPILGGIAAFLGILSALAAVTMYVRGSYAKARIESLRNELKDEREFTGSLQVRIAALEAKDVETHAAIAALRTENEVLRNAPQLQVAPILEAVEQVDHRMTQVHVDLAQRLEKIGGLPG